MAKFNVAQTSFRQGIVSKRFMGSTQNKEYFEGSEYIDNMLPMAQGGLKKRSGSELEHTFTTGSIGGTDPKQLAYLYTGKGEGVFLHFTTVGTVLAYSPTLAVTLDSASEASGLIGDAFTAVAFRNYLVLVSSNTQVAPVIISYVTSGSTVTVKFEKWFDSVLPELPSSGLRTPYTEVLDEAGQLSPAGTLGSLENIFEPSDVDSYLMLSFNNGAADLTSIVIVDTYISINQVEVTTVLGQDISGYVGTDIAIRKAYFRTNHYPTCVTSYQQRLVFGGLEDYPDTLFGSGVSSGFFFNNKYFLQDASTPTTESATRWGLTGSIGSDDPYVFNIWSDFNTELKWLIGGNVLYAGKEDSEHILTGYDQALGPLSVSIQEKSTTGSYGAEVVYIDGGVFYVSTNRQNINFLNFNERNGSATAWGPDSLQFGVFEELGYKVGRMVSHPSQKLIYAVLLDVDGNPTAKYATVVYSASTNSYALTVHTTSGTIQDIIHAVGDKTMYALTEYRTDIDKLYIERLPYVSDYAQLGFSSDSYIGVDCAYIYNDVATISTVTGLDRWANEEVIVLTDVYGKQTKTVDVSGVVTLDGPVNKAMVGKSITATVRTMRISGGEEYGASNGRPVRVDTITCDVINSRGGRWNAVEGRERYLDLKYPDAFVSNLDSYTARLILKLDTSYTRDPQLEIVHDDPYPFTVSNLVYRGVTYD
jgi:hypothetical protein